MESSIATIANIFTIITSVLALWVSYVTWVNRLDKSQKVGEPRYVKDVSLIWKLKKIKKFLCPQRKVNKAEEKFLRSVAKSDHCSCKWKKLIPGLWFSKHTEKGYIIYFTKAQKGWHKLMMWFVRALVGTAGLCMLLFASVTTFGLVNYTPWLLLGHAFAYFVMALLFLWFESDYHTAMKIEKIQEKDAVDAKSSNEARQKKRIDKLAGRSALALTSEFIEKCNDVFGAYFDAIAGIKQLDVWLLNTQAEQIKLLEKTGSEDATMEFMDRQEFTHEFAATSKDPKKMVHLSSQGDLKERIADRGQTAQLLANSCLVMMYSVWEDEYRDLFATSVRMESKSELRMPVFGELGRLRNAIIHNDQVATDNVAKLQIFDWFEIGEAIILTIDKVDYIFQSMSNQIYEFAENLPQPIPQVK